MTTAAQRAAAAVHMRAIIDEFAAGFVKFETMLTSVMLKSVAETCEHSLNF